METMTNQTVPEAAQHLESLFTESEAFRQDVLKTYTEFMARMMATPLVGVGETPDISSPLREISARWGLDGAHVATIMTATTAAIAEGASMIKRMGLAGATTANLGFLGAVAGCFINLLGLYTIKGNVSEVIRNERKRVQDELVAAIDRPNEGS